MTSARLSSQIARCAVRIQQSHMLRPPPDWVARTIAAIEGSLIEFRSTYDDVVDRTRRGAHKDHRHRRCTQAIAARLKHDVGLNPTLVGIVLMRSKPSVWRLVVKGNRFVTPTRKIERKS